jgi:UPF0755 protein
MNAGRAVKIVLLSLLIVLIVGGLKILDIYSKAFAPNVAIPAKEEEAYFYIHTGWTYDSVFKSLKDNAILTNYNSFKWTAERKNYARHIYPGRYLLKNRMSNNELLNMLRSGKQIPVKFTFNNIRTIEELAGNVSRQIEADSLQLLAMMKDNTVQKSYGLNSYTMACLFIPNTYEFYWNTSAEEFLERMSKEYKKFWNRTRCLQAENMKKSPEEIITLASIVDQETYMGSEKQRIAGVYVNRLEKGMRLQADPTVIFGLGDLSVHRVLRKHYEIDTPYNTYMHDGLPPGPICIPERSSIDAVLNYEKHDFLYFCARPDFSGYHNFSRTLTEHNRFAKAYQKELNLRRIYK